MEHSYTINNTPLESWGLQAGVIDSRITGYALEGAWSLPKRLGKTYHDWQGSLEPYVDADDIRFDGRDLILKVICKARSAEELQAKLSAFEDHMPDHFTLAHPVLGSYQVGLQSADVTTYGGLWGEVVLKLREPSPNIGTALPAPDLKGCGIDGYSWEQLGFVVNTIADRHNTPAWKPLNITVNPLSDNWLAGYRDMKTATISGTVKAADYQEFARRVAVLQTVIGAPGVRKVCYYDGSTFDAFCTDGFQVSEVYNFKPTHWGRFTCKMIVI